MPDFIDMTTGVALGGAAFSKETRNMNKERRKLIAKAGKLINDARVMLEEARDAEQDYFDNMPESFQNGEKGATAQECLDKLCEAIDDLENMDLSDL